MSYNKLPSLQKLMNQLTKLPGIGTKSAERILFALLQYDQDQAKTLSNAILEAYNNTQFCKYCFNLSEEDTCYICKDKNRDRSLICVVETYRDIFVFEKTNEYNGLYHVLNGHISPLEGIGPEDLKIKELMERITKGLEKGVLKEIILATNPNTEGEATTMYISKQLKSFSQLKISKLATGLPLGGDLEFTDALTLSRSIIAREVIH